jgi:hypothetical protein
MGLTKPYEHTQIGWVVLGSLLLPVPLFFVLGAAAGAKLPLLLVVALLLVMALLFASLTVRVDGEAISWRFGIGLVRRRIDLAEVRAFAEVENPWYWGWGIRYYRGGKLYNVSGLSAVELALRDGRRVRVGTDEPGELFRALEAELGPPVPLAELPVVASHGGRRAVIVLLAVVGLLLAGLAVLLPLQARPPVVTVASDGITIDNLFYGQTYPVAEIQKIRLEPRLPTIRARTNGYAAGGTLRGWFLVDRLGQGKLFVEVRHPPFILIYLKNGFVGVNFDDRDETERLFASLRQAFPDLTDGDTNGVERQP